MRKLISLAVLFLVAAPAFAIPNPNNIPEPEVLSMLAIGVVAMLMARRKK